MSVAALIVAAGRGSRIRDSIAKQYLALNSSTILRETVKNFTEHPDVDYVTVVINPKDFNLYKKSVTGLKVTKHVKGGKTRQDSVRLGLNSLKNLLPNKVLIHDAARPFVSKEHISKIIKKLNKNPAVILATPVVDTLKLLKKDLNTLVTVSRKNIVQSQTPQGFHYNKIRKAHNDLKKHEVTDDAAIAEKTKIPVAVIEGDPGNFKITTKKDYMRAKEITKMKSSLKLQDIRVGQGFDVHGFTSGHFITLYGVKIKHRMALSGHSDADVGLHSITDAILGALAMGDIGQHFPSSEKKWRNASSLIFLNFALDVLQKNNGRIMNLDSTIICESPKINKWKTKITARLSKILKIDKKRISIKGTTTDKLGFLGRQEGIAVQTIVSISLD
jgi:2-C-methyl-D-erythritol 4-phosphate cytidylyltransferase/2-C-methyl-D-erythritol 2,4-cyclodiphosphate synthase